MATAPIDNTFYADPQGLNALKRDAHAQAPTALRETARQFESLFTGMMLKSMRAATPKDPNFGSDQTDFYQDMFDQQLATQMSKGRGTGLAEMLVQQLIRGGITPGGASPHPSATATATAAPAAGTTAAGGTGAAGAASEAGVATAAAGPPTTLNWPPATKEEFIQALLPAATAAGKQLGVDPRSLIAHAALETGWGKSMPKAADGSCSYNLFGIKAGAGWVGGQVTAPTTEVVNGQVQSQSASFRRYASPADCMQDYANLLSGSSRYAAALGTGGDSSAFASALQRGGYATDPHYANKLSAVAQGLKSQFSLPLSVSDFS